MGLSVSPAEVDFVEEASFTILEDFVSQGCRVGEPELKRSTVQGGLVNARVHAGALRHGEVHNNASSCGVYLGPGLLKYYAFYPYSIVSTV